MKNQELAKEKALEIMQKLDIYKPYIKGFKENNQVCFFEQFGGFWADQEPELYEKMKQIEKEHNCLVYAITHEYTSIGEMYSFLLLSDYKEEWDDYLYPLKNKQFIVYSYVWNKTDEWCSEFGSITVQSFGGGIKRIA